MIQKLSAVNLLTVVNLLMAVDLFKSLIVVLVAFCFLFYITVKSIEESTNAAIFNFDNLHYHK